MSHFVLSSYTFACVKMSDFVPNNRHLRELLIFFFHSKKTAAEAHQELQKVYGYAAPSEATCLDWFRFFKDGDFDVDDRPREGRSKTFEDAELEALLDEDSCKTQEELASALGVTRQAIPKRLHALGMIQKQVTSVPYHLKPKDVNRRFFACGQLLERQKRKGFLHRIVTVDEKWIYYRSPKRRKSWGLPGHASTSLARPNIHAAKVMLCIWWDQVGVIYYELLKPNETITGERYRTQLMRLSRAVFPRYCAVGLLLFRSIAHGLSDQQFRSYEGIEKWLDSWIASKDEHFYRNGIRALPERWTKVVANDGQYFE